MEIGKKIQKIRSDNKLTQDDLAEKYFVTRQTISNWENGKSYPDLDTIVKISDDFNISLDKLLKEDDEMVKDISKKQREYNKVRTYKVIMKFLAVICIGMVLFPLVEYIGCKINNCNFVYYFQYIYYPFLLGFITLVLEVLPLSKLVKKIGLICVIVVLVFMPFLCYLRRTFKTEYDLVDYDMPGDWRVVGVETKKGFLLKENFSIFLLADEAGENYSIHIKDCRDVERIVSFESDEGNTLRFKYTVGKNGKYTFEKIDG